MEENLHAKRQATDTDLSPKILNQKEHLREEAYIKMGL
jgi:hypothetical protein